MMSIRNNLPAIFAHRNFGIHQKTMSKAMLRISSGYRINSAADDAAGLAISERMRGQIRGLKMASQNAQNAISMLQTAEGGLNETHAILQRMKELSVQASNGTLSNDDRKLLNIEYQALLDEIDRISNTTHYNGIYLLNGSTGGKEGAGAVGNLGLSSTDISYTGGFEGTGKITVTKADNGDAILSFQTGNETVVGKISAANTSITFTLKDSSEIKLDNLDVSKLKDGTITGMAFSGGTIGFSKAITAVKTDTLRFQVGANPGADQQIGLHLNDMSTGSIGNMGAGHSLRGTDILTAANANKANEILGETVKQVSYERARIGATHNRLEHTINNLENQIINLTDAESRIRDADIAQEMMNYTRANLWMQAAQAMMAQAMQQPNLI